MNTGGPRFLVEVFRRLVKDRFSFHIIAGTVSDMFSYTSSGNDDRINIINLNAINYRVLLSEQPSNVIRYLYKAILTINKVMRELDIDIIHLNSHFPNLLTYILRISYPNKPIICSIHHLEEMHQFPDLVSKIAKTIIQDLLEVSSPCDVVHTPSNSVKQEIESLSIVNKNNIVVIPPGIDTKKYLSIAKNPEEDLFLMIGRLEKRKHYDHALTAFRIVVRRKPKAKLFIIGDGPIKPYLAQLIKRFSLEKNVFLLGTVDEKTKLDLLSRAQALIHLGYPEGFGIAILEALATGTPVIAYDVPPINEIIVHKVTGILVKKDSVINVAEAIVNIDKYDFHYNKLREIAKKYDINIIAKKFEKLYKHLVKLQG